MLWFRDGINSKNKFNFMKKIKLKNSEIEFIKKALLMHITQGFNFLELVKF